MYISPVKSLALMPLERAHVDKPGIAGDRAFFIIDEAGKLFTQRQYGALVQIAARYDVDADELALRLPDGGEVAGTPSPGERTTTSFFGARDVHGRVVHGPWAEALSAFAGQPLRLVKSEASGTSFDAFPLSMCSMESVGAVAEAAAADDVDARRFRQNVYISGGSAHVEDEWLHRDVRAGTAVLRVKMRDPRCAITTHSPVTGEIDMNTLKIIASYRKDQPKEANFGVYCTIVQRGEIAVGDEVSALSV
jgi:hypothetical protein